MMCRTQSNMCSLLSIGQELCLRFILQDMENVITPTTMIWIHIDIQIYFRGICMTKHHTGYKLINY